MKKIKYFASVLLLGALVSSCNDKETDIYENHLPLETVSAELGASAVHSRTINSADPTLTSPAERNSHGHLLSIAIGSASNKADYKYDNVSSTWIPNLSSTPVYFTGYANTSVTFTLSNPLVSDPVAEQRGTEQQLIDADVLSASITNQTPSKTLTGVELAHVNSLLDITLDSSLDLSLVNSVKLGTDMQAYPVPVLVGSPSNYLLVLTPGSHKITLTVDYNGTIYTCEVKAGSNTSDLFAANGRYKIALTLNGKELVCGSILVKPWTEAETGSGTVDPL